MNVTSQGVLDAALQLRNSERAQVVQKLLDSLSPDAEELIDDAWATEPDRRLTEYHEGEVDTVSWKELKDQR